MKFEKFLKMTAGRGVIVNTMRNGLFLLFDGTMLKIPDGVNIIAPVKMDEPKFVRTAFDEYADDNISTAELSDAILPTPDAGASAIIRVWRDTDGGEIGVQNKYFGLIEKDDEVMTLYDSEYDEDHPAALLILTGYGENEEIAGIIFNDDYFATKINERK